MRKALLIVLSLLVVFAFGCGENKQEAKKEEAPAKAEATAEAKKDLEVGFVYVSPIGDAGYSYSHDLGRKVIADMPGVKTSFVESVQEGADSERVILNMARKGYDIIFATSFGYMDPMLKVAKDFPDTIFEHCSGYKTAKNMGNYFGRIYQARYLTGLVAGKMAKSNKIGYVAAFPIPEVIRGINAFTLGVREINPEAKVHVVWTKTWYDPALEKDAAKSLLDQGCDVIAQHQDSPGPQEAAQERGAYSIGYNSDMSTFAPKSVLTSAVWNWGVIYKYVVDEVRAGTWKSESLWWGLDKGVVDIAPYGPMVPEDIKQTVETKKSLLTAKEAVVFAGPVKDQEGKVRIAEGATAEDGMLLGMDWFVEGVVGSTK